MFFVEETWFWSIVSLVRYVYVLSMFILDHVSGSLSYSLEQRHVCIYKCLSWAAHWLACEDDVPEEPAQKVTLQRGIPKVHTPDGHRRKHTNPGV